MTSSCHRLIAGILAFDVLMCERLLMPLLILYFRWL